VAGQDDADDAEGVIGALRYEATRAIRADPALAQLPVVALTANALTGEDDRCRAAGCNDYIAKPYSKAHLLEVVARLLRGVRGVAGARVSG